MKVTCNINIPDNVDFAIKSLRAAGYEAYIVGGCVRDSLLEKQPKDWDITSSALPNEIKEVFSELPLIDTGIKHGTVTVVFKGEPLEITTYRIDGEYSDARHPDEVTFTDNIELDLARRDFTINAMAAWHSNVLDPFDGVKDLQDKLVRCVGDPFHRFKEDPLRILRGLRFSAVLGFSIEAATAKAMHEYRELLATVSQERITMELCKLLCGSNVYEVLYEFSDILSFIIPEIKPMLGFSQQNLHHIFDVYVHTIKAVSTVENEMILRIVMLLHDIGKPSCFTVDEKGTGHFYGHQSISAEMSDMILKRMRFSSEDRRQIVELVKLHDLQLTTPKSIKRLLCKIGEAQLRRLLKIKKADISAQNPIYAVERNNSLISTGQILDDIIRSNSCTSLVKLAINGEDLLMLGIPQGKQIGTILSKLLEMVIDEEIDNDQKSLIKYVKAHYSPHIS